MIWLLISLLLLFVSLLVGSALIPLFTLIVSFLLTKEMYVDDPNLDTYLFVMIISGILFFDNLFTKAFHGAVAALVHSFFGKSNE
ncbi:hypothetical protein [Bacillus sp. CGMCC 1.16541]|uniref:hypothetical protein n=1 Tax=Bacillus sp. CGMCC 1.16541 TaxID=2185143 RepID=UPI000D73712C|nr:hypothetical protein [Bacillus sp. CGMCC 1.16541]